jgi:aminoglycoside/choline kinase family phosphotransferase
VITAEWLSSVLGAPVDDVRLAPVGTGQMSDSVRLHLTGSPDLPTTLIAKLPAADPSSRATAMSLRNYEIEVRFYQQLAPSLPVRTPRVHYADIDLATADFVLLLEDLAPAETGDQLLGCSVQQAAAALDELVKLHAPRWDDPSLGELEWLHRDPEASRAFLTGLLPVLWAGFKDRYADSLGAEVHEAGSCLFDGLERYLSADTSPWTITHGDYRLDNLLFGVDGQADGVAVVDWQTCGHGPAMNDVAYFIGAGLLPEARRPVERELVGRYHAALGVSGFDWEQCWSAYRRGTWAGLIMAVAASMLVERTARGDDMFMAMAHRHARHALDLDAPALL